MSIEFDYAIFSFFLFPYVAYYYPFTIDFQSVDANDTKLSLRGACNGGELEFWPLLITLFSIPFLHWCLAEWSGFVS